MQARQQSPLFPRTGRCGTVVVITIAAVVGLLTGKTSLACSDLPEFVWVGSNGGVGAQHGDEGVRTALCPSVGGDVWAADDFYHVEPLDLDWDPTSRTQHRDSLGSYDIALSRVHSQGNLESQLIIAGEHWETVIGMRTVGASLFYCGEFGPEHTDSYTLDFDPTDGIDWHTTHTDRGTGDAFLTMLQLEDGMVNYGWTRTWGGTSYDAALDVDSDGDGNWVVGQFDGACDFNQDGNSEWRYSNGFGDVFVMRLSAAGEFLWVSTFGGDDDDEPFDVRVSSAGDGYVLGEFYGSVDFDPGPGEDYHTGRGGSDVFLSKYSSDGTYLWTRTLEPNRSPSGYRLEINREGELLIGGFFEDTMDVDPGAGELLLTARGDLDGLVSVWTPDGEHVWSRQIGGEGSRVAVGSAVFDDGGSVIAVGTFSGDLDFNDAGPPDVHASRGGRDAFMTRFSPEGEYEWTVTWGGLGEEDAATHATAHENGDITVAGLFQGTVDFDPGPGVTELTAVGNRDMFLLRFTCPQECPELLKHRASGGAGVAKSKVATSLPLGRATVECAGDAGTFARGKRLDAEGRAKIKLRNLPPGDYTCSVTRLEDDAGAAVCEGQFEPRSVTVE